MGKYNQETKDKAVSMAKEGVALKAIQTQIGPNPKATLRYLVKAGIDYKVLREELKAEGKLQTATKENTKAAAKTAKTNALKADAKVAKQAAKVSAQAAKVSAQADTPKVTKIANQ